MSNNEKILPLIVKEKQFTNDRGDVINYVSLSLEFDGQYIELSPKHVEDKKLLKYLIQNCS